MKKDGHGNDSESAYQTLIAKKAQVLSEFDSQKLEETMRTTNKNAALELTETLLPVASKYGVLIDLETCFNIKIDTNIGSGILQNRKLVGSVSENSQSIANADTDYEEFTPGNSNKKASRNSIKVKKNKTETNTINSESRNIQKRRNESQRVGGQTIS